MAPSCGQRDLASLTTSASRRSASSLLVSYSNEVMSWPVVEVLRTVPQNVTTAPQCGRVAHFVSSSGDNGADDTYTQSRFDAKFTLPTIVWDYIFAAENRSRTSPITHQRNCGARRRRIPQMPGTFTLNAVKTDIQLAAIRSEETPWTAVESPGPHGMSTVRLRVLTVTFSALLIAAMFLGLVGAPRSSAATTTKHSGTVDVLYAGSFFDLMQQQLDPAFHKVTGYTVRGISAGSSALASEISGGTVVGDVFISASPAEDATLQGAAKGSWVTTYKEFAKSPIVLGYNPASRFAKALKTESWYDVVVRPGFLLGRTDPATDPKGVLAVDALTGVALSYDVPALATLATSPSNIFEETSLVGELQAGQLDGAFFYAVEAAAAHIKTVPLVGTSLAGEYTVAILKNAPHVTAARAFVKFLLGKRGQKILRANGVTPLSTVHVFTTSSTSTTTTRP